MLSLKAWHPLLLLTFSTEHFFGYGFWQLFCLLIRSCISGKMDEAIDHLTETIMLNPTSAILYASRGNRFQMKVNLLCQPSLAFIVWPYPITALFSWKPNFHIFSKCLCQIEKTKCCDP